MSAPASRTRWDLRATPTLAEVSETVRLDGAAVIVTRTIRLEGRLVEDVRRYEDPRGGTAALDWLAPERRGGLLRPGERRVLRVLEASGGSTSELLVLREGLGFGWAELRSGAYEVAVERAVISRRDPGGHAFEPVEVVTTWRAPRFGLVAETREPAGDAVGSPGSVSEALLLTSGPDSHGDLFIPAAQIDTAALAAVQFGWDRGPATPVADLTADASIDTVGKLIDLDAWDFSGNTSANADTEIVSTIVPLDEGHTCNVDPLAMPPILSCGYDNPGGARTLARQDNDFDGTVEITNTVYEREELADRVVVWQRAGRQLEGRAGAFGNGESGFCYDPDFDGSVQRSPVAQWEFALDATLNDFVMQPGDEWATPFACEQNLFNRTCGAPGLFSDLYSDACTTASSGTHDGEQRVTVLKDGVVTLPSGHTFSVLLIRIKADFCVYSGSSCSVFSRLDAVRKFIYLWVAPHISTVVRLQSSNLVGDPAGRDFSTFEETDFKFGLFPPVSISVSAVTDSSVTLTWDPGADTHRIARHKVYWDTVSGGASGGAYAFDSDSDPGQVVFAGNEATVSGLAPGTDYFFTVTSLYSHADAVSGQVTEYESLVYPTQVFGDPGFAYPTELIGTTTGGTCTPNDEVLGLSVARLTGETLRFCWTPSSDPCVDGYDLLGSDDATSDAGWAPVVQTGLTDCVDVAPAGTFFLVTGRGTGGQGPWGHYGR